MCAAGLALAVMIAVSIGIPSAGASRKLYDMSIFLQPARGAPGRRAAPAPIPEPAPWHSAAGAKPQPPPVWTGAPLPLRTADASSGARGTSGFAFANIFSEFFLGFWRHDPEQDNNESDTLDLNAEIVFRKIRWFDVDNPIADFILSPRPLIGGSVHNKNETHTAYTELNWRYIFTNDVFIAGSFGLTYHPGNLERLCQRQELRGGRARRELLEAVWALGALPHEDAILERCILPRDSLQSLLLLQLLAWELHNHY